MNQKRSFLIRFILLIMVTCSIISQSVWAMDTQIGEAEETSSASDQAPSGPPVSSSQGEKKTSGNLTRHKRVHTSEKTTSSARSRKRKFPQVCDVTGCDKKLGSAASLSNHRRHDHGEGFVCKVT